VFFEGLCLCFSVSRNRRLKPTAFGDHLTMIGSAYYALFRNDIPKREDATKPNVANVHLLQCPKEERDGFDDRGPTLICTLFDFK
jgi:hypothetical protein